MFTIPNTKALALGGAGILIVSLFVLFRNQTSSDAEPSLPESTSPDCYREQKLLNKGKFPWEDAKVPNPNALSESEEREQTRNATGGFPRKRVRLQSFTRTSGERGAFKPIGEPGRPEIRAPCAKEKARHRRPDPGRCEKIKFPLGEFKPGGIKRN